MPAHRDENGLGGDLELGSLKPASFQRTRSWVFRLDAAVITSTGVGISCNYPDSDRSSSQAYIPGLLGCRGLHMAVNSCVMAHLNDDGQKFAKEKTAGRLFHGIDSLPRSLDLPD